MTNIPKELQEMFDLSQSVSINDLSKLIAAAKEMHEFKQRENYDKCFDGLAKRIEKLEIAMRRVFDDFGKSD